MQQNAKTTEFVNNVELVGKIGCYKPTIAAGKVRIANFSLMTMRAYKSAKGESRLRHDWHQIVALDQNTQGDMQDLQRAVSEERPVRVTGYLNYARCTSQDGTERVVAQIYARTVEIL